MILTIVILSLLLVVETLLFVLYKFKVEKKLKSLKLELEKHKLSSEFHINQLKDRYKGGDEIDCKRNSRKM